MSRRPGLNDLWDSSDIATTIIPTIAELSALGTRLTAYYGQSYCSPARAAFLSGKFTHKIGFSNTQGTMEVASFSNFSVPIGHVLLPEAMKRLGYATHGIGKWNIGHCNEAYMPWNRGFDSFHGYFSDGITYSSHQTDLYTYSYGDDTSRNIYDMTFFEVGDSAARNGSAAKGRYSTTLFNDIATSYLADTTVQEPIFLWLAHHGMHDDNQVDELVLDDEVGAILAASGISEKRTRFARGLHVIDAGLAAILDALEQRPRDFVLVLISDNGGSGCGYHCAGSNTPHRGVKFSDFEGALKLPAFVYAPALISEASEFAGLMHHVDWLATFVRLGGGQADVIDDGYDSVDQWDHIAGLKTGSARSKIIFSAGKNSGTVRLGPYKLMERRVNETWLEPDFNGTQLTTPDACLGNGIVTMLFNVETDPYEHFDLADDLNYSQVLFELTALRRSAYRDEYWEPTWPFGAPDDQAAGDAFHAYGGYVTSWGCDSLEMKQRVKPVPAEVNP